MMHIVAAALLLAASLGSVSFPTSTKNPAAQAEFERGLAALHSFWYEEAEGSFRRAQKADPEFAMAYWGEAMTHNHPIWQEQDREAARAILARAPKAPTAREQDWIATLEVLYGEGTKRERDLAYEQALGKLASKYADDSEAKAFHALAILGTMDKGPDDARRQIRAAAILEPLMASMPDHPGVLHYAIHAYDDPLHAPLGLRAARRYAQVAPEAHHALHMPSHIFLQLGMWNEAAASNEQSWAASKAWVTRDKLPSAKRDLHSLQWLQYIYLQQGKREEAKKLLSEVENPMSPRERSARAWMTARWIVETGEPLHAIAPGADEDDDAHCAAPAYGVGQAANYADALLAIRRGQSPASPLAALAAAREAASDPIEKRTLEVAELALEAMELRKQGKLPEALALAEKAAKIEESLGAPSGPPDVLKPSHELYGELLLAAGKPKEALEQFRISLQRMPNRAASLAGLEAAQRHSAPVAQQTSGQP
jgi:tetratricopeptide (TPR) repeat protein